MSIELNPIANPEKIGGFNTNFQLIEDELNENVLRRQGLSPGEANHMEVSLDMNSNSILNVSTDTSDPGSLLSLGDADTRFVFVSGDTMMGNLSMGGFGVTNLRTPTSSSEATRKDYVDSGLAGKVSKSGDSMSGDLNMVQNDINNIGTTRTGNLILNGVQVNPNELDESGVIWVKTLADLQALPTGGLVDGQEAGVSDANNLGLFAWRSGDQSVFVTSDTLGIYAPPDEDVSGASGAWEKIVGNLSADIVLTVGSGGMFSTVTAALKFAHGFRPLPLAPSSTYAHIVEIRQLAGFVLSEQIFADGIGLSHCVLTSDDAEVTIDRSALTKTVTNLDFDSTPAFLAINGGTLPVIDTLYNMDASGAADPSKQHGIMVAWDGSVIVARNKGVKNSTGRGLYGVRGNAYGRDSIWDGSGVYGIRPGNASTFNIRGASSKNCGQVGLHANGSLVVAIGLDVSGSAVGIDARAGATVHFENGDASGTTGSAVYNEGANFFGQGANLSNAGDHALEQLGGYSDLDGANLSGSTNRTINANFAARINGNSGDYTGSTSGDFGISAFNGSWVNISNSTIGGAPTDLNVGNGSTIVANGVSATTSQTPNIIKPSGVIYTNDVVENTGTAIISNGDAFVTVDHGLDVTPSTEHISVNPTNSESAASNWRIGNATATTFEIRTNSAVGADAGFAWRVRVI